MLSTQILRTPTITSVASIVARCSTRSFSIYTKALFEDSSKKSAIAIEPTSLLSSTSLGQGIIGNSFKSFAEYRKSATQHGPLRKSFIFRSNGSQKTSSPIYTEEKDYGVSQSFAKSARSQAYRDE